MKQFTALLLTITFFLACFTPVFAKDTVASIELPTKEPSETSIAMAINEETILANGVQHNVTAPILVFDRTYVDLYAVAPFLNMKIEWVEAYIGFFRVHANDKTQDFTLIFQWEDLTDQSHKFFVKDSKIFVSLRELTELVGQTIAYKGGIVTIGNQTDMNPEIYGEISTYHFNDYVFATYPVSAEHVVYPYQEYSYETMLEDAKKLQRMYPELIKTSSIGTSVEGRDLKLIEFGRGETKVFVCATHHAREYITTTYVMYAIDQYAYAYRTGSMWGPYNPKEILDNITFCIVPMVNPDGVNLVQNGINATKNPQEVASMGIYESPEHGYYAWKGNIRGVDLNWNYDKNWYPNHNRNPRGSAGFFGDYPNSEPEVVAICNYVDSHVFEAFLSFHTQGEIFYYMDNKDKPSQINDIIRRETGFPEYGDNGKNGGSFYHYAYLNYNKPTITVELCPYVGNYPYPNEDFNTVWNPAKNVILTVGNQIMREN